MSTHPLFALPLLASFTLPAFAQEVPALHELEAYAARAYHQLRMAELCDAPDAAARKQVADAVRMQLDQRAERTGADRAALAQIGETAAQKLDARPDAATCGQNARDLPRLTITPQRELELFAHQVHFQIRLAELCDQPRRADRERLAASLTDWLDARATEIGADRLALAQVAQQAEDSAEPVDGGKPAPADCARNARSLETLSVE